MHGNAIPKCGPLKGMAFFKSSAISLFLLSSFLFFLISTPHPSLPKNPSTFPKFPFRSLLQSPSSSSPSCSSILLKPTQERCSFSLAHCNGDSNGLFNYFSLHFCIFSENPFLSVPSLSLILLFHFYFLVKTAQDRFSVVVTKLSSHLNLSPSMGAVTLLALGNGAPDVFASVAAVRSGHARTGFGAILSAGTFVSALVVGFVAIYAAPFTVDPAPFIRDVFFYLVAAFWLFYVYLSAEISLWQAVGFVTFYVFFVGFVFWMDVVAAGGGKTGGRKEEAEMDLIGEVEKGVKAPYCEFGDGVGNTDDEKPGVLGKIPMLWEVPVSILLKLTIPSTSPSEWSRFYCSANIILCPLALVYSCSFFPLDHRIVFLLPNTQFPLWSIVLFMSFSLGLVHYAIEKDPPETEQMPVVLFAFVMSVFWISTIAGELLDCLAAVGVILKLPSSILGMTVLAWGNSVGDLVADVAVAKAGQPAMAMAGCFAGPMFNMLVGLGSALVIQTADVYPKAYELHFNLGIVVAFVFLFLSLMGSLLVVTWSRFRVPRFWGYCLVGLYLLFIVVSLVVAKFSG
ncbi:cation/calcium exchanger 5 [Magnolia sinica]|uniref:cation/calcium exchanger 5 n=1 Tax=Magnolia sinica TaxID=86752 RepID=UPI002659E079|nr:cation/calcium exchanger 5 [Magnolia sinica]